MKNNLQELQQIVEMEIKKAQSIAHKSKQDANMISQGALASPSTSGDREHAQNQALINAANLQKLIDFKNEIGQNPPKFIEIEFEYGQKNQFWLVKNPIHLANIRFVSLNSPLGQAVTDKVVGESFQYEVSGQKLQGKIISLD